MKKIIIIIFILVLPVCLLFTGCSEYETTQSKKLEMGKQNDVSMFICIEKSERFSVVYHRDTKVMYVISTGKDNAGNFVLLVNQDGTPMIYEGD